MKCVFCPQLSSSEKKRRNLMLFTVTRAEDFPFTSSFWWVFSLQMFATHSWKERQAAYGELLSSFRGISVFCLFTCSVSKPWFMNGLWTKVKQSSNCKKSLLEQIWSITCISKTLWILLPHYSHSAEDLCPWWWRGWNNSSLPGRALSCPVGVSLVVWVIQWMWITCDGRRLPSWHKQRTPSAALRL